MTEKLALITRPPEDAAGLQKKLAKLGFESLLAPMVSIEIFASADKAIAGALAQKPQAILITSANGARALATLSNVRATPVLAVGDASAREANKYGFANVQSAHGNTMDLARLTAERCKPEAGPLVHIAGSIVAGNLAELVASAGFTYRKIVAYHAASAKDFPPSALSALKKKEVNLALFYSPRTAQIFCKLAAQHGIVLNTVTAFALSPAVAERLSTPPWREIITASHPTESALLDKVAAWAGDHP